MKTFLHTLALTLSLVLGAMVATAAKPEPSELTIACDGNIFFPGETVVCTAGLPVTIIGTGFSRNVQVLITNTDTNSISYVSGEIARGGHVNSTNNLNPAGHYQVDVTSSKANVEVVRSVVISVFPI